MDYRTHEQASGRRLLRLLTLDGGGMRGFAELFILETLMMKLGSADQRPCEVFDIIAGAGTGGLIAIMLGRLGMSVQEAIEEYARLAKVVFNSPGFIGSMGVSTPSHTRKTKYLGNAFKARKLKDAVEDMLKRRGLDEDVTLFDAHGSTGECKTFVTATNDRDNDAFHTLRSYDVPGASVEDRKIRVWEAVRATMAVPGFFEPLYVDRGSFFKAKYIGGGEGRHNITLRAVEEAFTIFNGQAPSCIVNIGPGYIPDPFESKTRGLILPFLDDMCETLRLDLNWVLLDGNETAQKMHYQDFTGPGAPLFFCFQDFKRLGRIDADEWNRPDEIRAAMLAYMNDAAHGMPQKVENAVAALEGRADAQSHISQNEQAGQHAAQWSLRTQKQHPWQEGRQDFSGMLAAQAANIQSGEVLQKAMRGEPPADIHAHIPPHADSPTHEAPTHERKPRRPLSGKMAERSSETFLK